MPCTLFLPAQIDPFGTFFDCYGCNRAFTTYSGMIIHLEAGTCPSGINFYDLNETAAWCSAWRYFVHPDYRCDLLDRDDLCALYVDKVYPFFCPTCQTSFTKLSGHFQHTRSDACEQKSNKGAMAALQKSLRRQLED